MPRPTSGFALFGVSPKTDRRQRLDHGCQGLGSWSTYMEPSGAYRHAHYSDGPFFHPKDAITVTYQGRGRCSFSINQKASRKQVWSASRSSASDSKDESAYRHADCCKDACDRYPLFTEESSNSLSQRHVFMEEPPDRRGRSRTGYSRSCLRGAANRCGLPRCRKYQPGASSGPRALPVPTRPASSAKRSRTRLAAAGRQAVAP